MLTSHKWHESFNKESRVANHEPYTHKSLVTNESSANKSPVINIGKYPIIERYYQFRLGREKELKKLDLIK